MQDASLLYMLDDGIRQTFSQRSNFVLLDVLR
jgi:hypothetical protein